MTTRSSTNQTSMASSDLRLSTPGGARSSTAQGPAFCAPLTVPERVTWRLPSRGRSAGPGHPITRSRNHVAQSERPARDGPTRALDITDPSTSVGHARWSRYELPVGQVDALHHA